MEDELMTKKFWVITAVRSLKTFAATFGGVLMAGTTGVIGADWIGAASTAAMSTILTVCFAIAGKSGPGSGMAQE